jgi:plastocyanin
MRGMGFTPSLTGVARPLLAAAAIALVGCGGGGGAESTSSSSGAEAGGTDAVTIKDYKYKPAAITVPTGTTVRFTNEDSTAHTATSSESGAFDTDSIQPGKSGSIRLDKAGTFTYYCVFHPFMKGTVIVE